MQQKWTVDWIWNRWINFSNRRIGQNVIQRHTKSKAGTLHLQKRVRIAIFFFWFVCVCVCNMCVSFLFLLFYSFHLFASMQWHCIGKYLDVCTLDSSDRFRMLHIFDCWNAKERAFTIENNKNHHKKATSRWLPCVIFTQCRSHYLSCPLSVCDCWF